MKFVKFLLAALLALPVCTFALDRSASGDITTQNISASETCTAASCVELDITDKGTVSLQVSGTYTGALTLQRSNDRITWATLSASTTLTNAAGTQTATVASGTTGTFSIANVAGFRWIRVTALAAVTGTARVNLYAIEPGGGGGSSSGGGGAVTVADGADSALGATTDAAATAGSTGTVHAKLRLATSQLDTIATEVAKIDDANTQLPAALTTAGSLDSAVVIRSDFLQIASGNVTPKFAAIAASASGNNTIVAAVALKKIRVIAYMLSPSAAVNAKWTSNAVDLTGLHYMGGAGNGVAGGFNPLGYFESSSGNSLVLNLSGAVAVGGYIVYVEI